MDIVYVLFFGNNQFAKDFCASIKFCMRTVYVFSILSFWLLTYVSVLNLFGDKTRLLLAKLVTGILVQQLR